MRRFLALLLAFVAAILLIASAYGVAPGQGSDGKTLNVGR
jgi:hypothetical protein